MYKVLTPTRTTILRLKLDLKIRRRPLKAGNVHTRVNFNLGLLLAIFILIFEPDLKHERPREAP